MGRPDMSEQPPLPFDERPGLAMRKHPDTAHQAAARIAPRTGTMRHTILKLLAQGPATDEALWMATQWRQDSARPRRVELVDAGLVEDSHECALTASGRLAIIWQITDKGRQALAASGAGE